MREQDVTLRKMGKKKQGQAQASKKGRMGRRAGRMSGNDGHNSKKHDNTHEL